jgi:hypothetical protein
MLLGHGAGHASSKKLDLITHVSAPKVTEREMDVLDAEAVPVAISTLSPLHFQATTGNRDHSLAPVVIVDNRKFPSS